MKKRTLFLLGTAAAAGIYSAVTGKGPFNRIRFKEQHARIANYMETHYPKAIYMPVEATENGYVTVIKRLGMPDIILYITIDDDGNYIFTETQTASS